MRSNPILQEARTLHNVSDRLDALAGEHPIASDHSSPSGNVRHTAALLEVVVLMKMGSLFEPGAADA
jgi:hypothetical protein